MLIDEFDYNLPSERIAKKPARPRDSAKLMHVKGQSITDNYIYQLPQILKKDDVLVFNNTRVLPARIFGKVNKKKIEILIHSRIEENIWEVLAKPTKILSNNDIIIFSTTSYAKVIGRTKYNFPILEFFTDKNSFKDFLDSNGQVPIPPYLNRKFDNEDIIDYQTVFASEDGSVAAPTAGLHFTKKMIQKIKEMGVSIEFITLHIGIGTFKSINEKDIRKHKMHDEYFNINKDVAKRVNDAKLSGRRIIAVGTTALRALEASSYDKGIVLPSSKFTNLFIIPGHKFNVVDLLLTNFHLPRSSLMVLIAAFAGIKTIKKSYQHAINNNYRFYSYGDACLIEKNNE